MHPVLASFDFGEVLRVEGRWTRRDGIPPSPAFWDRPGSGVADDLLGHLLSVVRVGLAERPVAVTAVGWDRFGREAHGDAFAGHDTFEALIAFAGGPTAHLVAAWASNQDEDETLGVTFAGLERTVDVPLMARATDVAAFRPVVRERGAAPRVLEAVPVQTEECFVVQARNWVAAIRGEEELLFGAEDALAIQGMLDAAKASAAQGGRAVEIEELATVP
jgi:hypothetical protein